MHEPVSTTDQGGFVMSVATIELVTAMQHLQAKAAEAVIALVAFVVLAGVWLAYFAVIPLDLRIH
jgi:hypothetical protein